MLELIADIRPDYENKKELLALFVIVKFFVVVGFVSFLFWSIRRHAARQCTDTDRLLDELDQQDSVGNGEQNQGKGRNGWERDPDWWTKED